MDFRMEARLPRPPAEVWSVLVDIARLAGCIPGCEAVEEQEKLALYSAVMKQKVGPFRLEVPARIVVTDHRAPEHVEARATGRDKYTGTTLTVDLVADLEPDAGGSRLAVAASLQVAGKLASLGYGLIKKKAEENFAEFETRLLAALEAG